MSIRGLLLAVAFSLPAQIAVAQVDQFQKSAAEEPMVVGSNREWIGSQLNWFEWSRMTGDWNGHRTSFQNLGISFESFYISDTSKVSSGGIRRNTTTRSLFDVNATFDLEEILAIPGATAYAEVYFQTGPDGSRSVGDLQIYNNIDADNRKQLAELWYEQRFYDDRARIKVGKMDANREFAALESTLLFLNTAFLYSPTMLFTFPTYPEPATGIAVFGKPNEALSLGVGVYDGALAEGVRTGNHGPKTFLDDPSDLFLIGELDYQWSHGDHPSHGFFGVWHHTGAFPRFNGRMTSGTEGYYLGVEQCLWSEGAGSLSIFARHGLSDQNVSPVRGHYEAGVLWSGPLDSRPADALGIGFTRAEASDRSGSGFTSDAEVAYEAFYRIQVLPWFVLQPDVQWIHDPGASSLGDAMVWSLRIELAL